MFSKKTYILITLLIILWGVVFLVKKTPWKSSEEKFLLPKNINLNKIEIEKKDKTIILKKREDFWVVSSLGDFLADQEAVKRIERGIEGIKKMVLVSENPQKSVVYGLADEGIKIKLYNNKGLVADFIVGKRGPSLGTTYIKFNQDEKVYLVEKDLREIFSLSDYRDKKVLNLEEKNIYKINLKYLGKNIVWEKENEQWKIASFPQFNIEQETIKGIVSLISRFTAESIVDNNKIREKVDSDDLDLILTVFVKGGGEKKLFFNLVKDPKSGVENYYVKLEGKDTLYKIFKNQFKEIKKLVDLKNA